MIVNIGQKQPMTVSGRTVSGISIVGYLQAAAVNVQLLNNDLVTSEINLKVDLKRAGKTYTICNDDLRTLIAFTQFDRASSNVVLPAYQTTAISGVLVAHAAAVKAVVAVPLHVDFGAPINLRDKDELFIEVKVGQSAVSSDIDKTSVSYFDVDAIDTVGVESFTPYIQTVTLKGGEIRQNFEIGDNIQKVVFLNFDKTTILAADSVIDQLNINTDRYAKNLVYNDLLTRRYQEYETTTDANNRAQSFVLLDNEEFDKVVMNFTFVSAANVADSQNKIAFSQFYTDARLLSLAETTREIHQLDAAKKAGVPVSPDRVNRLKGMKRNLYPKSR